MKKSFRIYVTQVLFLLLVLVTANSSAGLCDVSCTRVNPLMAQQIQKSLDSAVKEFHVPGAILALRDMEGNTQFWTSGLADIEAGKPMTNDQYFRIGSVTKTYTATVILQLVDEWKLGLDDPVGKYLPGLVPGDDKITIRDLLEMRSGLGNYSINSPEFQKLATDDPSREWKPEELIKFSSFTVAAPGKDFEYNNANYILLGMIIEKITGDSFESQLKKRIFQPLGMAHTFVAKDMKMPEPYIRGYLYNNGKVSENSFPVHPSVTGAAGNIVSTPADQLTWAKALVEGRLLSPGTQAERFKLKPVPGIAGAYGLGVADKSGLIGHNGSYNDAYTCMVGRFHGYDCVIMVNGQAEGAVMHKSNADNIFMKVVEETGL